MCFHFLLFPYCIFPTCRTDMFIDINHTSKCTQLLSGSINTFVVFALITPQGQDNKICLLIPAVCSTWHCKVCTPNDDSSGVHLTLSQRRYKAMWSSGVYNQIFSKSLGFAYFLKFRQRGVIGYSSWTCNLRTCFF